MSAYTATEMLINATRVTQNQEADVFEFVLNDSLHVIECVQVDALHHGISPVSHFLDTLQGTLFELNHVRVNPRLDNTYVIDCLTEALVAIGVTVHNTPSADSMAVCYRPLGEITENVRFYFDGVGRCVFLCPNAKLKAVPAPRQKFG